MTGRLVMSILFAASRAVAGTASCRRAYVWMKQPPSKQDGVLAAQGCGSEPTKSRTEKQKRYGRKCQNNGLRTKSDTRTWASRNNKGPGGVGGSTCMRNVRNLLRTPADT